MSKPPAEQDPLFFGYYTRNTPYEGEYRSLQLYLRQFGLQYEYVGVDSRGSWQANTQMKAEIVTQMLLKHKGRRLVYVDVDSIILSKPDLFWNLQPEVTVAAVMYRGQELLSGVVYFRANDDALRLVECWKDLNRQHPDLLPDGRPAWDQRTLNMAIHHTGVRFEELPIQYNFISDLAAKWYPGVTPVILATRGAAKFKAIVNQQGRPKKGMRPMVVQKSAQEEEP